MGLKTPDRLTVPACFTCPAEYDQGNKLTRTEKRELFDEAHNRWWEWQRRNSGLEAECND